MKRKPDRVRVRLSNKSCTLYVTAISNSDCSFGRMVVKPVDQGDSPLLMPSRIFTFEFDLARVILERDKPEEGRSR